MLFHLHIEKTGGKTIEANVKKNIGGDCCRTSRAFGDEANRDFNLISSEHISRYRKSKFVTGHFNFGLHEVFGVKNACYVSLIREPVSRIKSYYNYILNSAMYNHKQFVIENALSFEAFALGEFDMDEAPYEFKLIPFNGQAKMIAASDDVFVDSEVLYKKVDRNINSVNYRLFPTENSTEAYYYILRSLSVNPLHRYVRVNSAPYDHVGKIDSNLRRQIEDNNNADMELYRTAKTDFFKLKKERKYYSVAAYLAKVAELTESKVKSALGDKNVNRLIQVARKNSRLDYDGLNYDGNNCYVYAEMASHKVPFYILPNDRAAVSYLKKKNWNDTPHWIWREGVRRSNIVFDVGSRYGEFVLGLEQVLTGDKKYYSLEMDTEMLGCQKLTVDQLSYARRVEFISEFGASNFQREKTDFSLSRADAGENEGEESINSIFLRMKNPDELSIALNVDLIKYDSGLVSHIAEFIAHSNSYFFALNVDSRYLCELLELLNSVSTFSSKAKYIYIWHNLFKLEAGFELPKYYSGQLIIYVTDSNAIKVFLDKLSFEYSSKRVKRVS